MPLSENQKQARYNYAKKSLKRIPLDVQKEEYEQIKAAADAARCRVAALLPTLRLPCPPVPCYNAVVLSSNFMFDVFPLCCGYTQGAFFILSCPADPPFPRGSSCGARSLLVM